ncbi:TonB-dependent receptor [Thalassotalea sp. 1_MG-2023]|uniref:TonB-dependent receptor n=1 Tax=Thalassotalea sp. 1_MG-2023 TaxID=3062680 RepID=UPI0026E43125|nr:TonB-dependent receptor [Thalassotalea sp. 1_MG-2023]MDO6427091.1 TonB-dependent receptor [Thalassotalea sp. 1_MG-2023]
MKAFPFQLTFIATLISPAAMAYFDEAPTVDDNTIERVIVTGSRIEESIDEVPATVTIISQQEIAQQMKITPELQDILAALVPGMSPTTGTSSNSAQTLRGRNPLVMIDGVPQSTPLRNGALGIRTLDASVIQRIEVIKGATSIFGNGAAGGIINYITKKAATDRALVGEISLSSRFSAVKFKDSAGHRITGNIHGQQDKFAYVISASYEENGVQRDAEGDILGLKYGLSDAVTENLFTKFNYYFDDEKSAQLTYNYYESQQETDLIDVVGSINTGEKTYAIKSPSGERLIGAPQGPRGNHNIMLKYTDDNIFADTALTFDAYKQDIENVFFFSATLANQDEGFDGGQSMIKSEKEGLRVTFNTLVDFENLNATFIYGMDMLQDITSQPLLDGRMWVPEMDMENQAFFLQSKWHFNNDIIVKAGVRRESIDLQVDDYQTLKLCRTPSQCSVAMQVKGDTLQYDATTYNFAIKYNYHQAFSPFISYSQGADISDIGRLLRTATVSDIADIHTEASVIDNYELGFTSNFEDIRIEFSAYRSTSELGTTNQFDPVTGVYMPIRAPQEIWGLETAVSYQISDTLKLNATASKVEGTNTATNEHLGGKQISSPKATLQVNWQPNQDTQMMATLLYVADRNKFEQQNGEWVGDQGPIDSYFTVNLSANHQLGDWQLFAGVENLLNKDYYPARSQMYSYSGYNLKGLGTTVTMGVSYQF